MVRLGPNDWVVVLLHGKLIMVILPEFCLVGYVLDTGTSTVRTVECVTLGPP